MLPLRQKEVLDFINQYQKTHGHGPTLDEMAKRLKRTIPTIHQHVQALRSKGYLKFSGVKARSIGIFDPSEEVTEIPLLGYVSAGGGIDNVENPEPIKVQRALLSPSGQHYALIVRGNSMIDDGILPDDIIIVKHQTYADNGDVVIALMGSEGNSLATVKRFYNHGDSIELRPRNPNFPPIICSLGEVEIRGRFVGLLRKG